MRAKRIFFRLVRNSFKRRQIYKANKKIDTRKQGSLKTRGVQKLRKKNK